MGMSIAITANDRSLRARLKKNQSIAKRNSVKTAHAMAADLVEAVQMHASGRPGPNVVTGTYRGSIRIVGALVEGDGNTAAVLVGTDHPAWHRLEFGFVGVDSLGRHYHQSPFPHWRPGIQDLKGKSSKYRHMLKEGM